MRNWIGREQKLETSAHISSMALKIETLYTAKPQTKKLKTKFVDYFLGEDIVRKEVWKSSLSC